MTTKPSGNHARLAAAVVVAVVVIGAAIIASSYLRTTGPCSDQVWSASISYGDSIAPVLLMRPDSTAHICVTYQSVWKGNASQYTNQDSGYATYQFSLLILSYRCLSGATAGCTGGWVPTFNHSFGISATPSSIHPTSSTNYVTITYTVTASSNSTGFYDSSAPYNGCDFMPMAVGYAASQVNASDFGGFFLPLPCPFSPFWPSSVSVGGMNVTYISFLS
jgi:hypothetical protein